MHSQLLVAEAPALQRPRPEVLGQDVGPRDQVADELLAVGGPEVDGDAALVAGRDRPPQRVAAPLGVAPLAQHVALAGRLDLDDLRAEVAEHLRAEGTRDHLSQFDDPDAGERSRHAIQLCCPDHTFLADGCGPAAVERTTGGR